MLIKITSKDICTGVPYSNSKCPIALACNRMGINNIIINTEIRNFVKDFDNFGTAKVLPIDIHVDLSDNKNLLPLREAISLCLEF